jgi:hypothetical protein
LSVKPKKTRQRTSKILVALGIFTILLGILLIGLVAADVRPLSLSVFNSQNGAYSADFSPASATVAPYQAQTFTVTLQFDPTGHQVTYYWTMDGVETPLKGASAFLFYGGGPGSHQIMCKITIDGSQTITCYATLLVSGSAPTPAPLSDQVLSLVPVDPLLRGLFVALGGAFAAFGSIAIMLSRRV